MAETVTGNAGVLEYSSPVEWSLHLLELVSSDAVCEVSVHWLVTGPPFAWPQSSGRRR